MVRQGQGGRHVEGVQDVCFVAEGEDPCRGNIAGEESEGPEGLGFGVRPG